MIADYLGLGPETKGVDFTPALDLLHQFDSQNHGPGGHEFIYLQMKLFISQTAVDQIEPDGEGNYRVGGYVLRVVDRRIPYLVGHKNATSKDFVPVYEHLAAGWRRRTQQELHDLEDRRGRLAARRDDERAAEEMREVDVRIAALRDRGHPLEEQLSKALKLADAASERLLSAMEAAQGNLARAEAIQKVIDRMVCHFKGGRLCRIEILPLGDSPPKTLSV